ncbi:thiol:disulfide interchange protein DsbA/DsbL [Ketobacter alkanivorans]|uniref:Thiol:disulfide interchange protein n=1 Tax=Ketobacter alkanivorans TaxID=1917421 RepID=A0A2K9LIX3_9GAMM|nr:thiol:disulfide interchange protein DsbA/DsbL [Ketobacter alkanivorans]AUM12213.1 hypothetical protein Kalk_07225 [Ketobacter alkanivorans]
MKAMKQCCVVLLLALVSSSGWAFSLERYVEGVHYQKVEGGQPQPKTVVEFFSFGCPHCYELEPKVEAWVKSKPEAVSFSRVPATWNQKFAVLGKLYYVIEALGIEEKAVPAVFEYLHKQNKTITSREDAQTLLTGLGVTPEVFNKAWNDPQVETNANTAGRIFAANQIRGVPAVVVNGQYQTSVSMAGSPEDLFEVVNFLLSK